ncbi:MAG: NUDIX domain-containing protein [Bacilli bacterium]|jgi:8-oxo-dGTP pyrophosphatase MutT (NUDIX family)
MSYIKELRNKVGHETIIMPCACLLIVDNKGNVLLQHRVDNKLWGYHGGSIEVDEKVEDALKREVKEELNIDLLSYSLFKIYSGKEFHYTYPNKDVVSPIDILFISSQFNGDFKLQKEEIDGIKWFSIYAMPKNMTIGLKVVINDYIKAFEEGRKF